MKLLLIIILAMLSSALNCQMAHDAKIYIAGHRGLAGSAIINELHQQGYTNIITRTSTQLDLCNQAAVNNFFEQEKPEYVFLAAAKVGGIFANMEYPAQFIYENLMIEANVIHSAYVHGVKKLLFLGSSCIYPRECAQPIKEEYLLTSALESTNEWYAIAKIAGLKMCKAYNKQYGTNFISCMPCNLYGPGDNFDEQNGHVIPSLISRMYKAKVKNEPQFVVYGSGMVYREFLFVTDCASSAVFLMNNYNGDDTINIGTGVDVTIAQLAQLIKKHLDYPGELVFDRSKADGTPRKVLDVSKLAELGRKNSIMLDQGLPLAIDWFYKHIVKTN